ncbi:MAG: glutathione S-transferase N-terminal domain-containing protein [Chloroflexi bacterium]|nr:glutathione S-transferase N-terminal domain-containing protein [Chloroflexota bacterium]
MIELIQFPWSPFCIVQRRILEYARVRFKIINIPNGDRSLVWRVTRQRYYQVPVIQDGKMVVFETDENSQVIAKYLDAKLKLGLFPREWAGLQAILWRYFENEIEEIGFKLNDIYYEEMVPPADRLAFLRHKERKFGRGCLEQWRSQQNQLLEELTRRLLLCEQMLVNRPFLLDPQPRFVDFDLFGMLGNFLYSGHYELPAACTQLNLWHQRMSHLKISHSAR